MPRTPARVIGWLLAIAIVVGAVWTPSAGAVAFPNDRYYGRQWHIRRIGAPAAWKTTKGKGVTVAVIDTGVNYRHEDLRGNMLLNEQYDAINDDFDALDLQGHGSGVAGMIAAVTNNKKGVAGIAPEAKIMAIRAFGTQRSYNSADVADGITWAVDNGADIINLSLGTGIILGDTVYPFPVEDPAVEAAVLSATAQGVLIVAAAGNMGQPACSAPAFNPLTLCVGATDSLDRLASFSNYLLRLDVVAPGDNVFTTLTNFGARLSGDGYDSVDGTSFAAPVVSGVAALLMSMGASNMTAATIIRTTAKDLGLPAYDATYGFGRVDANAAVQLCKQIC